ncbi:MAG: dihydrolipoamide acetyltransferase family protein [Vicinamibacterales bacterium]
MSTEVLMPQMGESIAEGTIVRWIKAVGDTIDKDEPLFEISTDKVDAEIPAPNAGVLLEILVREGETVPVNSVVATIGAVGETAKTQDGADGRLPQPDSSPADLRQAASPAADNLREGLESPLSLDEPNLAGDAQLSSLDARRRSFSSPVVRKIAKAHGIDIGQLTGTGMSGRVTRKDIMAVVHKAGRTAAARPINPPPAVTFAPGEDVRTEKMSVMRRKIADRLVASMQTSPHVYSAYEVDFSRVDALRQRHKAAYEAQGARLTYTAFIARATADTIREFPFANASLDGDTITYRRDVNLGIAVALEQGLIVPVIRKADERSTIDLCRAIQDLAQRARTKQLKVEDVEGGTFTITNPGIFGGLWGLPILNQPQVAILAVGSIDKRAVVVDDMIAARPMCYLTLGYDHRLIDGADGGRFLQRLKQRLEEFDDAWMA